MAKHTATGDIEVLVGYVERLQREVEGLRAELEAARQRPGASMRTHHRCPQCNGTSFLHLQRVRDHNYGDAHTFMAIQIEGIVRKRGIGTFEVYVCRRCELCEWYVTGASDVDIDRLDRANRKHIRLIDEEPPPGGVFR